MLTEGITEYRYSEESRAKLRQEHPELYAVAQWFDRNNISRFYGTTASAESRFVRLPEGRLVERSPESLKQIRQFEEEISPDAK